MPTTEQKSVEAPEYVAIETQVYEMYRGIETDAKTGEMVDMAFLMATAQDAQKAWLIANALQFARQQTTAALASALIPAECILGAEKDSQWFVRILDPAREAAWMEALGTDVLPLVAPGVFFANQPGEPDKASARFVADVSVLTEPARQAILDSMITIWADSGQPVTRRQLTEQWKQDGGMAVLAPGVEIFPVSRDEDFCRVCGCTDDDCSGCIERTGEPCRWLESGAADGAGLCSACGHIGARRFHSESESEEQFIPKRENKFSPSTTLSDTSETSRGASGGR